MTLQKPVITPEAPSWGPVSDHELHLGREHAQREYARDVDLDLLRLCADTTLKRWAQNRSVKLPFLCANVVRECVKPHMPDRVEKIEALKGAVMKIMSGRSAKKRSRDAHKRAQGQVIPPAPKQVEHPDDELRKTKGGVQLLLI